MLSNEVIGLLSLLATVACYWVNKRLYRKHPHPLLMPIVATPMVLIGLSLLTHVSYPQYIAQTHWLVWLLAPLRWHLHCLCTRTASCCASTGCR